VASASGFESLSPGFFSVGGSDSDGTDATGFRLLLTL
jgi:hypothetical protein